MRSKLRCTVFFAFVWFIHSSFVYRNNSGFEKKSLVVSSITESTFLNRTTFSIHPYYVSVTELKHNKASQSIEISCKMFTDNVEDALKKLYNKHLDLLHPKNKQEADSLITVYVTRHLSIKIDGKILQASFLGYEKEEEAIWCYFEIKNVKQAKKINIENSLLYEYLPSQMNMMHVTVNEKRQSIKLNNPDTKAEFLF